MWNYGRGLGWEDNSNTQFALLALREAAVAKVDIKRRTWELAEAHYIDTQNRDGGWGYHIAQPSTGSMTCSGIGSLQICEQMLEAGEEDLNPDGTPKCCNRTPHSNRALRRGVEWLGRHFAVGVNPGEQGGMWPLYYLYGVERAGRLSARRFFGPHDWYREGASYFVDRQAMQDGSFTGTTAAETDPVVASSFALLFLSKGLAPVLINKLSYPKTSEDRKLDDDTLPNWNLHPNDVRNLTEFTSGRPQLAEAAHLSGGRTGESLGPRRRTRSAASPDSLHQRRRRSEVLGCRRRAVTSVRRSGRIHLRRQELQWSGLRRRHSQPGRSNLCFGGCAAQAPAARAPDLSGRISPGSRGDRVVGRRLRLPDLVCLLAAGSLVFVGQMVVSASREADGPVQFAVAPIDESGSERCGVRHRSRTVR